MKLNYDALAKEYALHRQVHPQVLENLLVRGEVGETTRVLEVGCGTGNYIITLHKAVGCPAWGIDPSAGMLAKAQERQAGVTFLPGSAEEIPFPAESFDLLFSVDVIHHVGRLPAYFQEAHRVLKSGGKICTVTDSEEIIRKRRPLSNYFPETIPAELKRYPPISRLEATMAAAGFGGLRGDTVELAYPRSDIQAFRDKAYSSLHLISDASFQQGIARLEADLQLGPIQCWSGYYLLWGGKE